MRYKKGYKYQLAERETMFCLHTSITELVKTTYCEFHPTGTLIIYKGYAWDGPSGPTIDTEDSMTPSLGHDVLAQLMREGKLPQTCRLPSNLDFHRWCLNRGMNRIRAWVWRKMLDRFGVPSTRPENRKEIHKVG